MQLSIQAKEFLRTHYEYTSILSTFEKELGNPTNLDNCYELENVLTTICYFNIYKEVEYDDLLSYDIDDYGSPKIYDCEYVLADNEVKLHFKAKRIAKDVTFFGGDYVQPTYYDPGYHKTEVEKDVTFYYDYTLSVGTIIDAFNDIIDEIEVPVKEYDVE